MSKLLHLRQLCLVAADLEAAVAALRSVFGIETCYTDPVVARYGLENALLPIGTDFLEVVAPTRAGTAAGRYLERRGGDGGYMVILQCDDAAAREARMAALGVRIINRLEYPDYLGLQLHPKDTGGAMLETSTDRRGESGDGPWHPAGNQWRGTVRTDVVQRVLGAELQDDDPDALAARWAEVLDVPVARDAAGRPSLALAASSLHFVAIEDGRGEGLGGIHLACAAPAAVRARAEAAGCAVTDEYVLVCGVRFIL